MAATWLRPLHVNKGKSIARTLGLRTEYAKNPDKTEGGELVAGYECDPRSVDEEFMLAKREYDYITGRSQGDRNVLAYHTRISFKPGEITPQEALNVGYETATRFTKGKHAFVIGVHTDRKHIHCHIVFNSTTLDCTRKFKNFWNSSFALRRLSDIICAEHGLSVIENPKPSKGRDYGEWPGDDKPLSHKESVKRKIDELAPSCSSFEDLLAKLKADGYEVNAKRKYVSVRAPGWGKNLRLDSLNGDYTEATIRARIGKAKVITDGGDSGTMKRADAPRQKSVSLLIDIQAKIREGKGAGYHPVRQLPLSSCVMGSVIKLASGLYCLSAICVTSSRRMQRFFSLAFYHFPFRASQLVLGYMSKLTACKAENELSSYSIRSGGFICSRTTLFELRRKAFRRERS
jgi:hypothetical protein